MNINTVSALGMSRQLFSLSESELTGQLKEAVSREKMATLQVLEYLSEIDRRRVYAAQAYSSLFSYVVRELGYSESQAMERINSMRLLNDVPEVKEMLNEGSLSMTTASQIQRFIRNEKRFSDEPLDLDEKKKVIELCANQSKREVEKILFKLQSDEAKNESSERMKRISETHIELRFLVPDGVIKRLDEVRNLIGEATLSTIFTDALKVYLDELRWKKQAVKEEKCGSKSEGENLTEKVAFPEKSKEEAAKLSSHSRYVPRILKRMLFARSGGQCEFVDPSSKNRCLSRYRIEIDHIIPFAVGGKTEIQNLRHLCSNHNQRAADVWFC